MPVSGFLLMYEQPAMTASDFLKSKTPLEVVWTDHKLLHPFIQESFYYGLRLVVCLVAFPKEKYLWIFLNMVPKRLKEARETSGLTQAELSLMVGVEGKNPSSLISSYEVGRSQPPYNLVIRIAKALKYPVPYFYTEEDDVAALLVKLYQNRNDPNANANFDAVRQLDSISAELEIAKKVIKDISEISGRFIKTHR